MSKRKEGEQTGANLGNIEARQKRQDLRTRLSSVIRQLAMLQHGGKLRQILIDLPCNLELSGPIDETRLPMRPDGFTVKQATVLRHPGIGLSTLCLFQVVSMAVMYYWLYRATGDAQDVRSCERYCGWLEAYVEAPQSYAVTQGEHMELYLYPLKGTPEDQPHLPEWLEADDGETV